MNTPTADAENTQTTNSSARTKLRVERQFMQLVGTNIRTFDASDKLVCFAKAKAFKLREEVIFYADEEKTTPLFHTKARNIIDLSPTFDMFDNNGKLFGSLKRQGLMSAFAQDHWFILDAEGNQIGDILEDSLMMGIIRRHIDFVAYFVPQKYSVKFGATEVAEITQRKNPFLVKYDYDIDTASWDKYQQLFLAIANLLALIEARQN
jgi:hypothetical protein